MGEEKEREKVEGCIRKEEQTDSQMKERLECRWETRENCKGGLRVEVRHEDERVREKGRETTG